MKNIITALAVFSLISFPCFASGSPEYWGQGANVPPSVPEYMVFAGDTVRFGRPDLYERMDRELMNFSYMHSTSTLMLKRSSRYFPVIEPILKEQGIPDDLKYLMVIESSLDPKALSRAGAAGLWQFTKSTARTIGLEVSDEVDERYHIVKETLAACRYLREARSKYSDWMTVAASYNGGMNGISRKLAEQGEESALDLWLVEETARYMFRILAAKMFFENPRAFGFDVPMEKRYKPIPVAHFVKVDGPVESLAEFAKGHGVSYAELKAANLWLRDTKLVNKAGKTYVIDIPARISEGR